MLRRYGDKAEEQNAARAEDLTSEGDHEGAATWRRITDAVRQLATPPMSAPLPRQGTLHRRRVRGRHAGWRQRYREIASRRRFVVRGPIDAITTITATIALAMNRKTPIVP